MPKSIRTLLKLAFTLLLVGLLVRLAGAQDIISTFADLDWRWVVLMLGSTLLRRYLVSVQLCLTLLKSGLSVTVIRVFLANALAALYSMFLPGNIASAGVKWLDLSAATGKKAAVFNGLVYHRLVMTLLTLALGGAALTFSNPLPYESLTYLSGIFMIVLTVVFISLYHPKLGVHMETFLRRVSNLLPQRFAKYATSAIDAMQRFHGFTLRDHLTLFAWALLSVTAGILVLYCGIRAVGLDVSPLDILWISALLVFTAALPLTVANLGIREGFLVLALTPFGVAPAAAVTLGLLVFANNIMFALVGAAYQIALTFGWASWRNTLPSEITLPIENETNKQK